MSTPLETLVQQATTGDAEAVEVLLQRHLPALLGYVRLRADPMIRAHESCQDIVSSVCREVLEELAGFEYRGEAAFRKWLFTHALRKLIDRKRYYLAAKRNPARVQPLAELEGGSKIEGLYASMCSPSEAAIANEDVQRFENAFDKLPPDYQKVIELSRLMGFSHAEIGVELDRSEGAVRVLLHRALGRLGLMMDEAERGQEK